MTAAPMMAGARVPPQDGDAERALLGSILLDPAAVFTALEIVETDDFYRPGHRVVFKAVVELTQKSEAIDVVTVTARIRANNELDAAGGLVEIAALADAVPTAANVRYYAEIVRDKAMLRRLISAGTEIVREGFEATEPMQALDRAEQSIFEISKQRTRSSITPVGDIVLDAFKKIEELAEQKKAITGVPTGIVDLDAKTAGLQPSDLIIVAGRPSMGKTAFSLGVCLHAATHDEERKKVAVFSLEMSKESLVTRMLCSVGRIDSSRLRGGFLDDSDWPRLADAASVLSEAPIYIDDTGSVSVLEVRAKCRRLAHESGLDLVMIDYLQLMRGSGNSQNREQEISEISRGLKALAKELSVPVVALSQLNRSVESRQDKRPGLADLRESGAIEQDADVIMFIYRDEVYHPETDDRGVAEIIVGKQRNGPVGTVHCKFFHEFTRFDNLVRDESFRPRP